MGMWAWPDILMRACSTPLYPTLEGSMQYAVRVLIELCPWNVGLVIGGRKISPTHFASKLFTARAVPARMSVT